LRHTGIVRAELALESIFGHAKRVGHKSWRRVRRDAEMVRRISLTSAVDQDVELVFALLEELLVASASGKFICRIEQRKLTNLSAGSNAVEGFQVRLDSRHLSTLATGQELVNNLLALIKVADRDVNIRASQANCLCYFWSECAG
jgi:hypothetical protein